MPKTTPLHYKPRLVKNKNPSRFKAEIIEKQPFFYGVILENNGRILEITHHFLCKKIAVLQLNRRIRIFNYGVEGKDKIEELDV